MTGATGGEEVSSPLDRQIPELDAVSDSYDEDLGWILDRLLERIGADACAISVHDGPATPPRVLTWRGPGEADADRLLAVASLCAGSRRPPRERTITEATHLAGQGRQILSLWISADAHHEIILSVIYDGNAGAGALIAFAVGKFQPVLGGYFKLWLLTRAYRRRMTAMRAALDHTDLGIFLLDRTGRVLLANAAGAALLDLGDGLQGMDGALGAVDREANRKLRALITDPVDSGEANPPVIAVPRSGGRRPLLVCGLPITSAPADSADASIVVYAFSPDVDVTAVLAPVSQTYRLSGSESRLLALIASGESVAEAAADMGVKEQTVRAYLKNIFLKTGTTRQADLVRVVMTSLVRVHSGDRWKGLGAIILASFAAAGLVFE